MIGATKQLYEIVKLLLIFIVLTTIFYGFIVWMAEIVAPHQQNDAPRGKVIKVHTEANEAPQYVHDFKERLMFFYWFGE